MGCKQKLFVGEQNKRVCVLIYVEPGVNQGSQCDVQRRCLDYWASLRVLQTLTSTRPLAFSIEVEIKGMP